MSSARDGSQVARLRLGTAAGEVQVAATLPAFPVVAAGAVLEVDGRLRPPPEDDPYGEYLRRTGASGSLEASDVRILAPPDGGSLQGLRDAAGDALRRALPEPEAGLAAGILIGLRERVDRDLAADFATAGASHVVAISGWNIAIVAGLVGAMLRGRSRRLVAIAMSGTIAAYVVAAGASPSVVRAAVMAAVVLGARESGRAGRAAPALGMAAAILMLADPAMIGDAGFRLSVMATAGLLAWATPFGEWIGRLGRGRVPRWLAESLGISLAAQAATLPDVLATFGRLSLVSPVVNLAVVPLVPAAMAGGVVAMAAGGAVALGAPPLVGTIAGLPGWLVLHLVVAVVRIAAGLPLAAVALEPGVAAPAGALTAVGILAVPWIARRGLGRRSAATRARVVGRRVDAGTARGPAKPATGWAGRATTSRRLTTAQRWVLVAAALVVAVSTLAMGNAATRGTRLVDARRRPGGRDPDREPGRCADARGRRTGPGPPPPGAGCPGPALGPPGGHPRAHPRPRGPRRGAGPRPGAIPGGPRLRAGHARPGSRLGGVGRRPASRPAALDPRGRRPDPSRRDPAQRPVAGTRRRAARTGRDRARHQRHLDHPARRGGRAPVPADR